MVEDLSQETEMILAYKQSRQPNCVYCNHGLVEGKDEPTEANNVNNEDILEAVSMVSMNLNKPSYEITKERFVKYLDSHLLSHPKGARTTSTY